MRLPKRLRAILLAIASSVLLFAASEPVAAAPLAFVALTPLFVAVYRERRWWWAGIYGSVCGIVYFASHLVWIFLFGWMAWSALSVTLSLYLATATVIAQLSRRLPLAPILAAGGWVAFELLRDRWPFGGFPWGALGTSQASMPGVRWLAGTVGAYGLSFLAAFVAALIADRIVHGGWGWVSLALVAGVTVSFAAVDVVRYAPEHEGQPLRLVAVQGNAPRPRVPDQEAEIFRSHLELTRDAVRDPEQVDAVVWPESAVGDAVGVAADRVVSELARSLEVPMLVGRYEADPADEAFFNLVDHYDADGELVATYQKQHPVPFGEIVPLGFLRDSVGTLEQVPYDMVPGPQPVVFDVGGTMVGTPICFESAFPRDVRGFARAGAEVHVVATNDASFERSYASVQHLAHTRMRALELRQWIVQAAISGVSGVIGPDGVVTDRTRLFEEAVIFADVRARPAASLYARWGDVFSYGWVVGTLLALGSWWMTILVGRRSAPGDATRTPEDVG